MGKKLKCSELVLLGLPVLLLIGVGLALRDRGGANLTVSHGELTAHIKHLEIHWLAASPQQRVVSIGKEPRKIAVLLALHVKSEEPMAAWWGQKTMKLKTLSWRTASGEACKAVLEPRYSRLTGQYQSGHYVFKCYGDIPDLPNIPVNPELESLEATLEIDGVGVKSVEASVPDKFRSKP